MVNKNLVLSTQYTKKKESKETTKIKPQMKVVREKVAFYLYCSSFVTNKKAVMSLNPFTL